MQLVVLGEMEVWLGLAVAVAEMLSALQVWEHITAPWQAVLMAELEAVLPVVDLAASVAMTQLVAGPVALRVQIQVAAAAAALKAVEAEAAAEITQVALLVAPVEV